MHQNEDVVDLLISMCISACESRRREMVVDPFPPDCLDLSDEYHPVKDFNFLVSFFTFFFLLRENAHGSFLTLFFFVRFL